MEQAPKERSLKTLFKVYTANFRGWILDIFWFTFRNEAERGGVLNLT